MSDALKLVISGAGGRMGRALIEAVCASDGVKLVGAFERPGADTLGADCGELAGLPALGVQVGDDPLPLIAMADGLLDFTTPETSLRLAALCAQARIVHIIGTTGFAPAQEKELALAANHARIVKSGNMSMGVIVLAALVKQAAVALADGFDIEIAEMHHRHKVDAPSGTALLLGEAAAAGRGVDLREKAVRVRDGHTGARQAGAIGFATLRGGSVVGDHTVILAGEGERLELSHRAQDREIFARGAVRAALWAYEKKPGLYSMYDVLGLSD